MKLERFIFCQYCDDVRYEVDGKISLVGVYPGGLVINANLPATISKLFVVCNLATPKEKPFQKVAIRILLGDKEVVKAEVPQEELSESALQLRNPSGKGYMLTMAFPLFSLLIENAGYITVELESEEGVFQANRLEIRVGSGLPPDAQGIASAT
ncbi:hypothetical protein [Variovorax sp. OV084]|uniref:DUF6941 family protein n=1 Tax=Variovorax sp. OV084 TaxID=1882777 RepID=UPI00115FA426|nr:hypothetical protein [Variovorax sp. OV084]